MRPANEMRVELLRRIEDAIQREAQARNDMEAARTGRGCDPTISKKHYDSILEDRMGELYEWRRLLECIEGIK